jgi:ABC-type multidrug transport system ATPase subunit/ABC-type multidrug transport system permease subunit
MSRDEFNPKASWVIGRSEHCDLVVAEAAVSSRHCRLTHEADGFTVEDLDSTNGTFVNGVRIEPGEPVTVHYGARVTLGTRIEMPWPVVPSGRVPTIESPPPPVRPSRAKTVTIGRAPESDVQVDLPIVSWNHAIITLEDGKYFIEDRNSRNGTSIGQIGNRIQRAVLDPSSDVFLGSYKIAAAQLLASGKKVEIGEGAGHKVKFTGNTMEIGRDPQCDVPLAFPMVSWRHARLTRAPEGILVEDLDSRNGTYVDGIRIGGKVLVKPGQEIGLGSFRFQLLEGGELAQREYYGNVTIEANGIVVHAPNGKRLLNPVSLTVFPSELVALMGPAGAGKTTLLKALNGYTKPVEGKVLFNGYSLYDYYDRFRQQMGYVPQDDIVHPQLTVRQALYFSARLRTDLTDAEINARTEKVLHDLGIPDKIDTVIGSPERKTLSGGQRKRVNIALELITDTPLLFLDEPTSGLSSYDAESVVDLLKALSKTGKTVITTIHQPSLKVYKQFDDLLMVSRDKGESPGALVFFGPAYPDSIQFFNPVAAKAPVVGSSGAAQETSVTHHELNPEMLFSGMNTVPEANRTETWRKRYEASRYQKEFVEGRSGKQPAAAGKTGEESPRRQFGFVQWLALVRRNLIVKLQDRAQTAILLIQAPLFAVLVVLVNYPLQADHFDELAQKLPIVHFLMVVAAIWFGCNNAARDIVGEWTIYKRERMVTLKLVPYVFSKLAVLFGLCAFQCGSMLAIVYLSCGLHSNLLNDFLVLLVSSMIGAGLGLCISALSKTNESAIALLPVVLLPIIALGGGMRPVYLMPKAGQVVSAIIPSRWSYEANLLGEATASEWGRLKLLPDLKCKLGSTDATAAIPPPGANVGANGGANAAANPAANLAAIPKPGDDCPANDDSALCSDAAETSIPRYLITYDDNGTEQTCRATANQSYPHTNPTAFAVSYRHSFRESLQVLFAMLLLLMVAVIVILRRRDKDPQ